VACAWWLAREMSAPFLVRAKLACSLVCFRVMCFRVL
jgi:hypothetical protein